MKLKISVQNQENLNLTEKGFILGASEDGTIYYRPKKNQYNIEIEQKILQWLDVIKETLENVYGLRTNIRKTKIIFFI